MNTDLNQIENKNYSLNFNQVFNESWALFTKVLGIGALAVIIHGIASFLVTKVAGRITGMNYVEKELEESMMGVSDFNVLALELQDFYMENMNIIISTSLMTSLIMLLAFPLAGGFMLVCREMDKNGAANVGTLFEGFKPKYWGRLMVLAIVYFIVSKIAMALFLLPGIYIWVAAVIACPFIMFTNASGIKALTASVKLINKNWFTVFQILFVASLIGIAGYLLCGFGRIVSYPFVLVTVYMLYKHIVGFGDDQISKIGED